MSYDEIPEDPTFEEMLFEAISANNYDLVIYLIDIGVDLNCYDWFGWTPLQNASSLDMVALLIKHGANPDQENQKGRTVWMTAAPELIKGIELALIEQQRLVITEATPIISHTRATRL